MTTSEDTVKARESLKESCHYCIQKPCLEECTTKILLEALDLLEKKEQNRIIELPVPIGSKVYCVDSMYTNANPHGIFRMREDIFDYKMINEFGKSVFDEKEMAWQRVKELRNEC